ncbi:hypothetical protein FNV43_RR16450 [Rhamnella rubrinervis]|uniref:Potassium transporter n=1 Tax=Rhamnella rubrinervis TaxID=2594499 RepID=A0A8K0MC01_9ROSA|nr:hypothetical protein FNV43_RR16450 [Rhamnella rubrinervis]
MANIVAEDNSISLERVEGQGLVANKLSWNKLMHRSNPFDIESRCHNGHASKDKDWRVILHLALQSIGIAYGDIGTSPLYVYASTFTRGINHEDDILGVLSLILYTLTLIPLINYIFIILRANDNGDGGTLALYSLICKYAKVGLTPSEQEDDMEVSNFQRDDLPNERLKRASRIKYKLEKSQFAKYFLLFATMLGTSMVIGDGVLTPCISVLSAVGGIKQSTSTMTEDMIVWISVGILVCLFMVQRFGTDKVGYTFAPITCLWFALIGGIGVYNYISFDPTVIKAINPKYIVDYFRRNKAEAWISLGGVVLTITGSEALFADAGHFTVRSIQISMCTVTYPALIMAYIGQASFLRKHTNLVSDTFYKSIPDRLYWPVFVVAIAASIIASQAMISGTFSIIQQSVSLGCFPRVKITHTSTKYRGQVYVPEANYLLMLACIGVTLGFKTTAKIGNAYGIAVVFVMTLTSSFLVLIMLMIWKTHLLLVISYVASIGTLELIYLSSVLYKFDQGGYLPLAFALALMSIMFVWNDVHRRKYHYELKHKISTEGVKDIVNDPMLFRIPGLAIFHSELVQGSCFTPMFKHYMLNVRALHSVLVFVSINSLPISDVEEERFLFSRVEPKEANIFHCVVRFGYTDYAQEYEQEAPFERVLVTKLKEFVKQEFLPTNMIVHQYEEQLEDNEEFRQGLVIENEIDQQDHEDQRNLVEDQQKQHEGTLEREIEAIDRAWNAGIVHLIGDNQVIASKDSAIGKKLLINYAYDFLRKNSRQCDNNVFDIIPHKRMLKIGMTYEL